MTTIKYTKLIVVFSIFLICSCSENSKNQIAISKDNFYLQSNSNRMAAEWEPALGTMVVWPLCIPYKLAVELSKDNHLFTMVADDNARQNAVEWYAKWGIDTTDITFIYAPQGVDAWWVRDWGPSAVFTPEKQMKLGDGKYIYSTPKTDLTCNDSLGFLYFTPEKKIALTEIDDNATKPLGEQLGIEILDLPFVNTGGNFLSDGIGTSFSTCVITSENRFDGTSEERFIALNKQLLGISRYNIISNFEKYGIQHIDCFMKLLNEETILVAKPPTNHELYGIYDSIVTQELSKLKTPYNRPYQILRIDTDNYNDEKLAAYTNSLILNKTVYVPLFGIQQDSLALNRWSEVMPGYEIKGFTFSLEDEPLLTEEMKKHYPKYGWKDSDALHCRTRAIWDPEMLFISAKRIDAEVDLESNNIVYATIIDYSKKGLKIEKTELLWRLIADSDWKTTSLNRIENTNHFYVEIPYKKSGANIEYFISAVSTSGRSETQPRTAPLGVYTFSIK